MFCANYFPRSTFANKNPKEFIHHRLEKLKAYVPEIPERIAKSDINIESILKCSFTEYESIFLDSFRGATKAYSETYVNGDFSRKTISPRAISMLPKQEYDTDDDEWIMQNRRYIYDNFMKLEEKGLFQMNLDKPLIDDPDLSRKIDLQDLISFYEKDLYDVMIENEKGA